MSLNRMSQGVGLLVPRGGTFCPIPWDIQSKSFSLLKHCLRSNRRLLFVYRRLLTKNRRLLIDEKRLQIVGKRLLIGICLHYTNLLTLKTILIFKYLHVNVSNVSKFNKKIYPTYLRISLKCETLIRRSWSMSSKCSNCQVT